MRNMLLALLAITLAAVASNAEQEPQKPPEQPKQDVQQPALPDYTKDPFLPWGKGTAPADLHPEEGIMAAERYLTSLEPRPGASLILIFKDKDDKPKYAEWLYINDDGTQTLRYYAYKSGAWQSEQKKE